MEKIIKRLNYQNHHTEDPNGGNQMNSIEVQFLQIQIRNLTTKNLEDSKSIQATNCSDDSDSENENNRKLTIIRGLKTRETIRERMTNFMTRIGQTLYNKCLF